MSTVTLSMDMMRPPAMLSLLPKALFLVFVDGWNRLEESLIRCSS